MISEPPDAALERWPASVAWRRITVPPLEPRGPVRIAVAPGETWCTRCGSDGYMPSSAAGNRSAQKLRATCIRCGSPKLIPADQVLQDDEYFIIA